MLNDQNQCVKFLWIPSHVGVGYNAIADTLAKEACSLPPPENSPPLSLSCCLSMVRSYASVSIQHRGEVERQDSITIRHYDSLWHHTYKYRRRGLMVRRHNVVSARLRLGYRPPWQITGVEEERHFTECCLCHQPRGNTVEHYCMACPTVRDLLTQGQPLEVCRRLLVHDALDIMLTCFPHFGGFS